MILEQRFNNLNCHHSIMMKYVYYTMLFLSFSCKKHVTNEPVKWECDSPQILDSAAASNKTVGTWKLVAVKGGMIPGYQHKVEDVELVFNSDATYVVKGDSQTSGSGTWNLTVINGEWLRLETNPGNRYLNGSMLFCEDNLSFWNSHADGLDFLFSRK